MFGSVSGTVASGSDGCAVIGVIAQRQMQHRLICVNGNGIFIKEADAISSRLDGIFDKFKGSDFEADVQFLGVSAIGLDMNTLLVDVGSFV